MKEKRVESGVAGYDELVDGGFTDKSINLVVGGSGSGKSLFALQFLLQGLRRNETVLYVTFEEKKEDFFKNMRSVGYDLEKAEKSGKFIFLEYAPEKVKMMLDEGGGAMETTIFKNKVTRFVIDSLTSFALLFDDEQSKRQATLNLFDIIRKWPCTSLLTVQYDPQNDNEEGISYVEFEADGITFLYHPKSKGTRRRYIEVTKMRGTNHSKEVHAFKIGKGGLSVGSKAG